MKILNFLHIDTDSWKLYMETLQSKTNNSKKTIQSTLLFSCV